MSLAGVGTGMGVGGRPSASPLGTAMPRVIATLAAPPAEELPPVRPELAATSGGTSKRLGPRPRGAVRATAPAAARSLPPLLAATSQRFERGPVSAGRAGTPARPASRRPEGQERTRRRPRDRVVAGALPGPQHGLAERRAAGDRPRAWRG